ncbi:LOG family protein [Amycolatopsis sp. NPDC049252]|uniref:LOG family protein n=1 Tax=Amycolatopsis sp. NPDC049252 TaxID=3363933 RepID=UPI00371B28E6
MTAVRVRGIGLLGGTTDEVRAEYLDFAAELGAGLGGCGVEVVCGDAGSGVAGSVIAAAAATGSAVVTVVPHPVLPTRARPAPRALTYAVRTAGDRRRLIYRLSDGFVVLPGGLDTIGDLIGFATLARVDGGAKPIVLVNVRGYFDALFGMLDHAVAESFLTPAERGLFAVTDTVPDTLRLLAIRVPEPVREPVGQSG